MAQEYIVVEASPERDPEGARIDGVFEAQMAIEQARSRRDAWMHLLALVSIPVWVLAAWPAGLAGGLRSLVLAGWATCFGVVLFCIGKEWQSRRKRAALLETLQSDDSAGALND